MFINCRLAEVGRLLEAKEGKYDTGQLFLHRIFGYRGVVLFPWTARVYDRDLHNPSRQRSTTTSAATSCTKEASPVRVAAGSTSETVAQHDAAATSCEENNDESTSNIGTAKPATSTTVDSKDIKGKRQTFYQVLIDTRDCPHIVSILTISSFNLMSLMNVIRSFSVPRPKLLLSSAIKIRIEAYMQFLDWIMLPTMTLCHTVQRTNIPCNTNYSTSF